MLLCDELRPGTETGLPRQELVTSTALTSCLASLGVGLLANLPFGMAPGMGLNIYLAYSQVEKRADYVRA
jgi:xanthine/uracil/vitamin C permease (AzgA family)